MNNSKNTGMREGGKLGERMRIQAWRGMRNINRCQHQRELGVSKV